VREISFVLMLGPLEVDRLKLDSGEEGRLYSEDFKRANRPEEFLETVEEASERNPGVFRCKPLMKIVRVWFSVSVFKLTP